jgi:DNA-directed RNA polymerase specialized sigma24 family protein
LRQLNGRGKIGRPESLGKKEKQAIIALYVKGLSTVQIANKCGCSISTARRVLLRAGITLRPTKQTTSS